MSATGINPHTAGMLLRACGVCGAAASCGFSLWRLVFAAGTDDDNTVRFKVLYSYLVLFCVAIATAELNMIPSNVLKLALFLQSNMGRGLFYILMGTLIVFSGWLGFAIGLSMIGLGVLNIKAPQKPGNYYSMEPPSPTSATDALPESSSSAPHAFASAQAPTGPDSLSPWAFK
mmetsp:Transcript_20186/g.34829  ORF Transcript_20186/g.34829 Transcript_20186/m.34829 type:complete len:174 (+) Transcript_20186:49-570(+)|eukprot:CAMPEP_0174383552 /NCGR_PEP_ID=MMETSP0811_2-20130205/125315_1 /TAXON_ID=73025 ORGANISM="Eutreptiella gymnastica-like, Strain CCMP1594" /NCGR_SAMPLE_ID=MMETSP0811_2 /ASSEMBLY_ACC=CAM_ASM_000667 /LENGTH=173 /DNA_ID=CAMNT_0015537185 /DNA_START=92 /DNA_END=613 /DNA_ORIENTATION=-